MQTAAAAGHYGVLELLLQHCDRHSQKYCNSEWPKQRGLLLSELARCAASGTHKAHEVSSFPAEPWVEDGVDFGGHLQTLHRQGYTVLPRIIPNDLVERLKSDLDLPPKLSASNKIQKCKGSLLTRSELLCAALRHSIILKLVRLYVHPHVRCATWLSNTLYPRSGPINNAPSWHVDYPYHCIQAPWQPEPVTAQVIKWTPRWD